MNYFLGTAALAAQVSTVRIITNDGLTTYTVTIGDQSIGVPGDTGGGGVNQTASDLRDALEASTHPYFTAMTYTVAADTVTMTAKTAGVPFVATTSVSGGTGTIGAFTTTTASAGPNHWDAADNWSAGHVPQNGEDVEISNSGVNICWGLAQSAVTLDSLRAPRSFYGKLGLDYKVLATSADGETYDSTAAEYRDCYLQIKVNGSNGPVQIGQHVGPGQPSGTSRFLIDLGSTAAQVEIHGTANSASELGRPAVRILANSASTDIFVRSAPGGVGIAIDRPGETSTIGDLSVSDQSTTTQVFLGPEVIFTSWDQAGGNNVIQAAAAATPTVSADGGVLTIEGEFTVSNFTNNGATVYPNNTRSGGTAITNAYLKGGTTDATQSSQPRTWANVYLERDGVLVADDDVLTVTDWHEPDGRYTLSVS